MRPVLLAIGSVLATLAIASAWVDEGEVVMLTTFDAREHAHETALWIVDVDGSRYVRAELPGAGWLARLRARPEARLERGGAEQAVRAVPVDDPALRRSVAGAMAAKYDVLDRLIGLLRGEDSSVLLRLEPLDDAQH